MIHDSVVVYTTNLSNSSVSDWNRESFITHPNKYKSRINAKLSRKLYYNSNAILESTNIYKNDFVNVEIIGYQYYPSYKIKIKDERGFILRLDGFYFNKNTLPKVSFINGQIMEKVRYYINDKQIYLTID